MKSDKSGSIVGVRTAKTRRKRNSGFMKSRMMQVRLIDFSLKNAARFIIVSSDVDYDPVKVARDARTSRVAKNERQRLQNIARAQAASSEREERKKDLERTLASTRTSTASMGKFDRKLEGEKKLRGVKRKVNLVGSLLSCHSPSVV